jgi:pyruvate dehydrogenase E2 component (dihydrolipoamide acetyltransferase)
MATPIEVRVPDIGGFKDVSVIDVLVEDGQHIDQETPMVTLETEKAAMDVPAPAAGRIAQVKVKKGDKVSEGSVLLLLEGEAGTASAAAPAAAPGPVTVQPSGAAREIERGSAPVAAAAPAPAAKPALESAQPARERAPAGASSGSSAALPRAAPADSGPPNAAPPNAAPANAVLPKAAPAVARLDEKAFSKAYASPSVRKFARELGADLGNIKGTGPKARITHDDVKAHVKKLLTSPAAPAAPPGGAALPKLPEIDFAQFGAVEIKPLSRIQLISGARLQASWINLPHVTQHEDADITDLEIARVALKGKATQEGVRLTPLAFIIKACIAALKEFPRFNASLDASGKNLVLKKYFHIGFAADTPNGLLVPVIRDADRMNLFELARALAALSEKARIGKLSAAEMQGGTFTISSLGGIGGTSFTPIINAPEVAILGVSRSVQKPVFDRGAFVPRLMLPMSLSYDHRVIDGAAGARFIVFLSQVLGDVKAML